MLVRIVELRFEATRVLIAAAANIGCARGLAVEFLVELREARNFRFKSTNLVESRLSVGLRFVFCTGEEVFVKSDRLKSSKLT